MLTEGEDIADAHFVNGPSCVHGIYFYQLTYFLKYSKIVDVFIWLCAPV